MSTTPEQDTIVDDAQEHDSPVDEYGYNVSDLAPEGDTGDQKPEYDIKEYPKDEPEEPDAETAEPKESEQEAEEPAAISRDDYGDYGLSEQEARDLDAKGALGSALDLIDRRISSAAREKPEEQTPDAEDTSTDEETGLLKFDVDWDEYDGGLAGMLKSLMDHVNTLHGQVAEVTGHTQGMMNTARRERMDAYFDSLGEEYADVFGKGPLDALPNDSPAKQARIEVDTTAMALMSGYEAIGQSVPSEQVLLDRAARVVAGGKTLELARKQVEQDVKKARAQHIARPTHREGEPLSADERAVRFAEQFYRRKGM